MQHVECRIEYSLDRCRNRGIRRTSQDNIEADRTAGIRDEVWDVHDTAIVEHAIVAILGELIVRRARHELSGQSRNRRIGQRRTDCTRRVDSCLNPVVAAAVTNSGPKCVSSRARASRVDVRHDELGAEPGEPQHFGQRSVVACVVARDAFRPVRAPRLV
jgi:hypothetical protein